MLYKSFIKNEGKEITYAQNKWQSYVLNPHFFNYKTEFNFSLNSVLPQKLIFYYIW